MICVLTFREGIVGVIAPYLTGTRPALPEPAGGHAGRQDRAGRIASRTRATTRASRHLPASLLFVSDVARVRSLMLVENEARIRFEPISW